jgi:hypothetical protein
VDENTRDVLMVALPLASALGTAYIAVLQSRAAKDIKRIETNTNNNTALLAAASKAQGHGEGVAQERADQQTREGIR